MATYTGIVLIGPADGRTEDFEKWFFERHIPDVTAVPGFKGGELLKVRQIVDGNFPTPYAAIYTLETDDLDATMAEMARREASGEISAEGGDCVDIKNIIGAFLSPVR